MFARPDFFTSLGLLILRVGIAGMMAFHGWDKVGMLRAGQSMGDPIGLGADLSLKLVIGAELVCALLVLIGLLTRLAALPVVFAMGVAAFVVHAADPWTSGEAAQNFFSGASKTWFSKEPALTYLAAFAALVFTGPGRFSVDDLIFRRRRPATTPAAAAPRV